MHRHNWIVTARRFTPPNNYEHVKARNVSEEILQHILHGSTVTAYRCNGCGREDTTLAVGDSRPAPAPS